MDGGQDAGAAGERRGGALLERMHRYRARTVTPVREVRGQLSAEAIPYEVHGRHVRVNPRLLSYWIPFVAGVGVMIGGMKTAGIPYVGIPQLILGIALIAVTGWDFLAESGRLDVKPSRSVSGRPRAERREPVAVARPSEPRKTYDDKFRRHAVHMVRSTGQPIAVIARDLNVKRSTLAGWVKKDRLERERLGITDHEAS